MRAYSSIRPDPVKWIWPGRLPANCLSLLMGSKGAGKSTIAAAIAAHVTGGPRLGNGRKGKALGDVLWCSREENPGAIRQRLEAAGALLQRVHQHDQFDAQPSEPEAFADLLTKAGVNFVILDPCTTYGPASGNDENPVRAFLEPLTDLCHRLSVTILMIGHTRKGRRGAALDAGLGSVAWVNVPRHVVRVDQTDAGNFLSCVATNAGPRCPTISYEILSSPARVKWGKETDLTSDQLAEGDDPVMRDEQSDAETLLLARLKGSTRAKMQDLMTEAQGAGVSLSTLRRAKKRLGIVSFRRSVSRTGYWEWGRAGEEKKKKRKKKGG